LSRTHTDANQPTPTNQPPPPKKTRFFRHVKDSAFVKRHLLDGLPPLPQRHSEIKRGAGAAASRSLENERRAAASQMLYINDVASWDFACVVPPETGACLGVRAWVFVGRTRLAFLLST
jgi:hypothetical protein